MTSSVEEAFELSDASAERNAAACTLALPLAAVVKNVTENVDPPPSTGGGRL